MKKFSSILLSLCIIISILVLPTTAEATGTEDGTSIVEQAVQWAIKTAKDDSHGYNIENRGGNPDYDCSSFVSTAFKKAGIDITPINISTRNMRSEFTKRGFICIKWKDLGGEANLKKGDILLREKTSNTRYGHTELYIGNYQMVGAHSSYGNTKAGDQNGNEVSVCSYSNSSSTPWQYVLRCPEPTCIYLNRQVLNLATSETCQLTVTANPEKAITKYTWTSSNPSIATVNSNGKITPKKIGTTVITVTSTNGKKASCTVTVKTAPYWIQLNTYNITLGANGDTYDIYHYFPSGTASYNTTYTSSNTNVATVNASNGLVTAKKTGTALIYVKTHNGLTATCKVTVKIAPYWLQLNRYSVTLGANGDTYDINHSLPYNTASYNTKYFSSNTSVATVNATTGVITAKKTGTAKITVKTHNGLSTSCSVTVKNAPSKVTLNKTNVTLGVNETFDLNHTFRTGEASYNTKYSSSNTSVAVVNATTGVITAKKVGTAKITVKTFNGKTATCTVTVKNAPSKISLNKTSATLKVGQTLDLNSSLPSGTASYSIKYSSSNTGIATVNSSGLVTAKKSGTAIITAKTYNGKTATCKITVK